MSLERGWIDYAVKTYSSRVRSVFVAPRWYLALKLRWTRQSIDRLERVLAGEFALLETAPLHDELVALIAERDALVMRLSKRRRRTDR